MDLPENVSGMMPPEGAQASPSALGAGQPPQGEATPTASPQEQAEYDQLVTKVLGVLDDKKALPAILRGLNTEDPAEGVAAVTASLVARVAAAAQKAGTTISEDVLFAGAAEVFEQVVETAEAAGVHEFSTDQQTTEGAFIRAMDEVRVALQDMGMVTQEGSQAGLEEIRQADASGQLAGMLGGEGPAKAGKPRGLMQ